MVCEASTPQRCSRQTRCQRRYCSSGNQTAIPAADTIWGHSQVPTTDNRKTREQKSSKQDTPLQVITRRRRRITETGRKESSGIPSDHLTGHFISWVRRIAGQAKVCDLELPVRGNEQVVRLQILSCEKAYQNRSN